MQAAWLQVHDGPGQQEGDRVWWEEGKELIVSEAGSYSWRIASLESDKPMVAQLLCLSFLITEMTVPTS